MNHFEFQSLFVMIGTRRLATSRYWPSLAETDTDVRALSLEEVTLRSGDGAEDFTSGVATKRVLYTD